MARIRSVKPSFFTSQVVATLPLSARLTFIGLWTYADDDGRGIDDARLVKAAVWPLDDNYTSKKVEADLALIEKAGKDDATGKPGLIVRYEIAGRRYLAVTNWTEHQRTSHPKPSTYPPPPTQDDDRTIPERLRKPSGNEPEASGEPPAGGGGGEFEGGGGDGTDPPPAPHEAHTEPAPGVPATAGTADADVIDLCRHLARRIALHRNSHPVKHDRPAWTGPMRLLVERGPTEWATPEPIPPDTVRRRIDEIFDRLNKPDKGFCWADNIRSPETLRKQWDRLGLALNRPANGRALNHVEQNLANIASSVGAQYVPADRIKELGPG